MPDTLKEQVRRSGWRESQDHNRAVTAYFEHLEQCDQCTDTQLCARGQDLAWDLMDEERSEQ
jgi:hypothetical protein